MFNIVHDIIAYYTLRIYIVNWVGTDEPTLSIFKFLMYCISGNHWYEYIIL